MIKPDERTVVVRNDTDSPLFVVGLRDGLAMSFGSLKPTEQKEIVVSGDGDPDGVSFYFRAILDDRGVPIPNWQYQAPPPVECAWQDANNRQLIIASFASLSCAVQSPASPPQFPIPTARPRLILTPQPTR